MPTHQADNTEAIAKLLTDVYEGDRLTLVYEPPTAPRSALTLRRRRTQRQLTVP